MHQISEMSRFSIDEITKVEGAAGLDVEISDGKVTSVKFKIEEFKRFYTHAIEGKPLIAVPQLLARVCGTCSNAHLMAAVEGVERGLGMTPSEQTKLLRRLTYHGLIIRDHALHLYMFCLPDIFKKDSLLAFDENDSVQHQLLDDAFAVKAAGNHLAIYVAGRSVHAPYLFPGGFTHTPDNAEIPHLLEELKTVRPAVLRLIDVFGRCEFSLVRPTNYAALVTPDFSYLEGEIHDSRGRVITEDQYREHLEHVVIPYSHSSGYIFDQEVYRVGALARLNINKDALHERTKSETSQWLERFPSDNIFDNNLAQAIEILHSIDDAIDQLEKASFVEEKLPTAMPREGVFVGVVEAPRGMLYHKFEVDAKGIVKKGEIIVPTGQNQIAIEHDLKQFIEANLDMEEAQMALECEKIIRAYDPCMSCASHFLQLNLKRS